MSFKLIIVLFHHSEVKIHKQPKHDTSESEFLVPQVVSKDSKFLHTLIIHRLLITCKRYSHSAQSYCYQHKYIEANQKGFVPLELFLFLLRHLTTLLIDNLFNRFVGLISNEMDLDDPLVRLNRIDKGNEKHYNSVKEKQRDMTVPCILYHMDEVFER